MLRCRSGTATWLETSRRVAARVGDNAIVLNQDGIDVAAMEREPARQFQAIIVAGNRVYP
ncbi:hypothetical protein [Mycobacterium sp.]|uniref:hypothetical protein n=1 Tax=Mycobacterium sp. TaxID=1785 RepID=UPI003C7131A3